uniref:Uncharacterized protein n=1 Tax=Plectus sambesii TaxID=2011161 RepID=A0A914WEU9_9BILA
MKPFTIGSLCAATIRRANPEKAPRPPPSALPTTNYGQYNDNRISDRRPCTRPISLIPHDPPTAGRTVSVSFVDERVDGEVARQSSVCTQAIGRNRHRRKPRNTVLRANSSTHLRSVLAELPYDDVVGGYTGRWGAVQQLAPGDAHRAHHMDPIETQGRRGAN